MKKSVFKISSFFLLLGLCWISIIGRSQDLKLDKKEKKEARKAEKSKNFEAIGSLLESRKFVFEARTMQTKDGTINTVNPNFIFFRFDSTSVTNQPAATSIDSYFHNGTITYWELSRNNKNLNYIIRIVSTLGGSTSFQMFISADRSARVKVSRGNSVVIYNGQIKTFDKFLMSK